MSGQLRVCLQHLRDLGHGRKGKGELRRPLRASLQVGLENLSLGDPMEEDQEIDFSAYKVPQLKEELKARGLRTSVMVVPFVSQPECHIISLSSLIHFGAGKQEGPFRSPSQGD